MGIIDAVTEVINRIFPIPEEHRIPRKIAVILLRSDTLSGEEYKSQRERWAKSCISKPGDRGYSGD